MLKLKQKLRRIYTLGWGPSNAVDRNVLNQMIITLKNKLKKFFFLINK